MNWKELTVGSKYRDFVLTKNSPIKELNCQLIELTHEPTGAEVLHIANDDPENLFCLSFQTVPDSSNGVAHILEHTVLCGSKKFPVKDPFFCMNRRSLNTYLNALTGSDFTCYPGATQIEKDFYNLLEVYLDAVFQPNLDYYSFLQEGHRLEFTDPENPNSPLQFKGVVYNEMKGVLSSPTARLQEAIEAALFPNTTYGYDSGGDPQDIPQLSYEELIAFHKRYYHPSRCLFFFYGSFPLENHLNYIEENVLRSATKKEPLPPIPAQKRFHRPRRITTTYPITEEENCEQQAYLSFAWLTTHVLNQEEILALSIIDSVLMDTDASPLKRALLKSGMCSQAYAYLDPDIYDVPFIVTLRGCREENADSLEELLFNTLKEIVKTGISQKLIDSALHQMEFYRSEITGDHSPYGLTLFMRSALLKQHGADAEDGLAIHSLFKKIKNKLHEDKDYFVKLIQKFLIDNNHFVRVVDLPDTDLSASEEAEEEKKLEEIKRKLNNKLTNKILNETQGLKAFQEEQENEDPTILPKLTLEDIPKTPRDYTLNEEKFGDFKLFHHSTFTNSIIYADLQWKIPNIPESDLWLLKLYATILPQMGMAGRSYEDNLDFIQENLGGFGSGLGISIEATDRESFTPIFNIQGKALYRKEKELFHLLLEATRSLDFSDRTRLKEVFLKHFSALQATLTQSSLRYAISLASSGESTPCKLSYLWNGLPYYHKIREIAENFDEQEEKLLDGLLGIQNQLQSLKAPHLILSCDQNQYDSLKKSRFYELCDLPTTSEEIPFTLSPPKKISSQAKVIASPIAFTCKVLHTVPYCHPDAPALSIVAPLLEHLTLHRALREQGGAYGGGATYNSQTGNFLFYSFRDPNINSTLSAYQEAVERIVSGKFNETSIEEAIFDKVQSLDAPISPGSRAKLAHSWLIENKSIALRQKFRDQLLSLTKEEIIKATKKHLAPHLEKASTVIFAGKELLKKESPPFPITPL